MAKRRIKVSRHGLTTCPSCLSHIHVSEQLEETNCPFCGANLVQEVKRSAVFGGGFQRMLGATHAGLLAAALVGTPMVAGCGEDEAHQTGAPDLRAPSVEADMGDEPIFQPEYGVAPPEDMGMDADTRNDMEVDMGDEPVAQPLYGIAPPADMGVEVDMGDEPIFQPEYGVSPPEDMG